MTATRAAAPHELIPGAVIRVPPVPGLWARPFGLEIAWREPASKETGVICLGGYILAQDGTTTRKRRPVRDIVVIPGRPVTLIRKAPPREFTAKIATLACPNPDPELRPLLTTRWGVVDSDGNPLPAGTGTGPARAGDYVQVGDWEGKPTPWLANELADKTPAEQRLRRDPLDQCIDRVRQERGILHVGRLTYDLSVWPHSSAQELRPAGDGNLAWRDTYVCKRCAQPLKWLGRSPWTATLDDDEECHGETWIP